MQENWNCLKFCQIIIIFLFVFKYNWSIQSDQFLWTFSIIWDRISLMTSQMLAKKSKVNVMGALISVRTRVGFLNSKYGIYTINIHQDENKLHLSSEAKTMWMVMFLHTAYILTCCSYRETGAWNIHILSPNFVQHFHTITNFRFIRNKFTISPNTDIM